MKVPHLIHSIHLSSLIHSSDAVLIDLPMLRAESCAFSVPLTSIYLLSVHLPTLSSWCRFTYSTVNTTHWDRQDDGCQPYKQFPSSIALSYSNACGFQLINTSIIVHCNHKTQQSSIGVEIELCKLASPCKWVSVGDLCTKEVLRSPGVSMGALETVVQGFQRARMRVGKRWWQEIDARHLSGALHLPSLGHWGYRRL